MMKLLIISHALIKEVNQRRWRTMAVDHEIDIRILIPEQWYNPHFGEEGAYLHGHACKSNRFEVCTVPTTSQSDHTQYRIRNLRQHLQDFRPDVIFCIHEEGLSAHRQTIVDRKLFLPHAVLIYFSMRVFPRVPAFPPYTLKQGIKRIVYGSDWRLTCFGTDAALVHYPGIEMQMRAEGYQKRILHQTQIGVDPELFHPDATVREQVRLEQGWHANELVIGTSGRLVAEKGMFELLHAVERLKGRWRLVLVGDGPDRPKIEDYALHQGLRDRVHVTGYVSQEEVARLMQGMDIFTLGSINTPTWVDTFPLVVAQAMATALPVVGSGSGAIPYQLDDKGLVFHEGCIDEWVIHLQHLMDHPELRRRMGAELQARALTTFAIKSMNQQFILFCEALRHAAHE